MDQKRENCYFWTDSTVPEDKRTMSVMCVGCREKNPQIKCWLWEGSKNGYGPFDYVCEKCGRVIYSPSVKVKNEENAFRD